MAVEIETSCRAKLWPPEGRYRERPHVQQTRGRSERHAQ